MTVKILRTGVLLLAAIIFANDGFAQGREVPVPVLDTPARTAKVVAYRDAAGEMSSHLCREPNSPKKFVEER